MSNTTNQQPQTQQASDAAAATSTSNVPVKQECCVPGKDLWVLWRTNFEIDQHYAPIKVRAECFHSMQQAHAGLAQLLVCISCCM